MDITVAFPRPVLQSDISFFEVALGIVEKVLCLVVSTSLPWLQPILSTLHKLYMELVRDIYRMEYNMVFLRGTPLLQPKTKPLSLTPINTETHWKEQQRQSRPYKQINEGCGRKEASKS